MFTVLTESPSVIFPCRLPFPRGPSLQLPFHIRTCHGLPKRISNWDVAFPTWSGHVKPIVQPRALAAQDLVVNQYGQSTAHESASEPGSMVMAAMVGGAPDSKSPRVASSSAAPTQTKFCIVNFYYLTVVRHPFQALRAHQKWMLGKDIQGRIYISAQGINAQYSGVREHALAYAEWVSQQPGFEGLQWAVDDCEGHLFPKLRLKIRPNLVSLAGGTRELPITDPEARAKPLSPTEWQDMLRKAVRPAILDSTSREGGASTSPGSASPAQEAEPREVVVLDVRNAYEWDAGHFEGAARPLEETFKETPTDASGEAELPESLRDVSPETPVMMYCTGGIRCDIYSTYLRKRGFKNLYTLEKGIQNYLKQKGSDMWKGSLFVFDARMAVAPGELPAAAPCQMCGGEAQLPHMNCANIDCNKLYLACLACKAKLSGCCCEACLDAPRLVRPPLDKGYYAPWMQCATESLLDSLDTSDNQSRQEALRRQQAVLARRIAEGRGDGRTRRRLLRRERMTERMRKEQEEHDQRRAMIKEALQLQAQREAEASQEILQDLDAQSRLAMLRQRRSTKQQGAQAAH